MWNNRAFKKVNLTANFFSGLASVFSSKDKIRQIVCDESRHILYILHDSSKIAVYDLGDQGNEFRHVCTFTSYKMQHDIGDRFSIDYELLKEVTYISVVPSTRSMYVNLVATLKSGYRAYFTCYNDIYVEREQNRVCLLPL